MGDETRGGRGRAVRGPAPGSVPRAGRPAGLGVAVVFDWALGTQLAVQALVAALHHDAGGGIAVRLVVAAALFSLGEALRRGRRAAWLVQLGLLGLVTVAGLRSLPGLLQGQIGRASLFSVLIELTYAPWLIWRLLLPRSVGWFSRSSPALAARTTGPWLVVLAAWSLLWGVAVAFTQALS